MKIKYLGTAAAEGIPAMWCNCDFCNYARKVKGKDFRARTQAIVDGDLLIDMNADTYINSVRFGVDLSAVKNILITHSHIDHCVPFDLAMRGEGYAKDVKEKDICIYGSRYVKEKYDRLMEGCIDKVTASHIGFCVTEAFKEYKAGDYTVTPLPAEHTYPETAFVYLIEKAGKSILYFNDTGMNVKETLDYLEKRKKPLSFIGFDGTYGTAKAGKYGGHMSLFDAAEVFEEMKKRGIADENTKRCVTHFSHWNMLPQEEMQALADRFGFSVCYDGAEYDV